jgi:uncharacterized protein YcfJ
MNDNQGEKNNLPIVRPSNEVQPNNGTSPRTSKAKESQRIAGAVAGGALAGAALGGPAGALIRGIAGAIAAGFKNESERDSSCAPHGPGDGGIDD